MDNDLPPDRESQWKVGTLEGSGPGLSVFRSRIPAVKASSFGPGGRSYLVAQRETSGEWIVRNLHASEEVRLFSHPEVPMFWGTDAEEASTRRGNSGPAPMMLPIMKGLVEHCRPAVSSVPADIDDIISPSDIAAFRGHMHSGYEDYKRYKLCKLTETTPGTQPVGRPVKRKQCKGGMVLYSKSEIPYYLADYWETGNIDDVVPAEYLAPAPSLDTAALTDLFRGSADQELVTSIGGHGVSSKDTPAGAAALLSTNHEKALLHHKFVDDMYEAEVAAERMVFFDVEHSPAFFPSTTTPTGATTKKKRTGEV